MWLAATPGAVGLAHPCSGAHQHVGGTAAEHHLCFVNETLAFPPGSRRQPRITAELGCRDITHAHTHTHIIQIKVYACDYMTECTFMRWKNPWERRGEEEEERRGEE